MSFIWVRSHTAVRRRCRRLDERITKELPCSTRRRMGPPSEVRPTNSVSKLLGLQLGQVMLNNSTLETQSYLHLWSINSGLEPTTCALRRSFMESRDVPMGTGSSHVVLIARSDGLQPETHRTSRGRKCWDRRATQRDFQRPIVANPVVSSTPPHNREPVNADTPSVPPEAAETLRYRPADFDQRTAGRCGWSVSAATAATVS